MENQEPQRLTRPRKKKKKKRKGTWLLITLVCLLLIAGTGYIFRKQAALLAFDTLMKDSVTETLDQSYEKIDEEVKPEKIQDPFSILLLGTDERKNEPGRSDTIIYSVVRPEDGKILLISIPRDTYTEIAEENKKSKINAAYARGGIKRSVDTVENLVGNNVDFYATINFQGLKDVVDKLGGVHLPITNVIENKQKIHEKLRIEPNKPIYNGEDALSYARYREDSDFNRTMRHRVLIDAVMARALEIKNLTKIPDLIKVAGSNFKTNMNSTFMIDLAKSFYEGSMPTFSNYMLKGKGAMRDSIWYYDPDQEDVEYIHKLIANWHDPNIPADQLMQPDMDTNSNGQ
ncbi:LytR family transcriptional regulator [Paenibacillus sp. HJL G12]|uniref:LytR family transcriptional regulator n=1 Tax=Paenibacillus dendrobii TaxID=2691084 RepID=A0A7X3LIF9_9BACL|nr:LCP family protein [Paenibacillus dendrobii]MWV44239.1 LytR family transcriptional regulator [Paenibacillus dendrobii]